MLNIDPSLFPQAIFIGLMTGVCLGALTGAIAGFAGVGGGLIYVPALYVLLPNHSSHMSLVIFSSLLAVAITGFFSARAHWRLQHVRIDVLQSLLPSLVIGASIGLWLTLRIPESFLLLTLATLNLWIAWDYGREQLLLTPYQPALRAWGLPIGAASGALGIGGGTMLVPLLRRWLTLRHAIGTAAACGMLMATMTVLINILFESTWRSQLAENIWLLFGIWLGIAFSTAKASAWAARFHSRHNEALLRQILRLMFFMLAIGLFSQACYG